eukprot:TRINITY_DN8111_c0_g1_i1.p1 TRINITY_DN8111_c0_g1~~TRINITY_DN8111_c0_g1_i1.p1  ORF type:complete len:108 (+),score=15.88 TRINITY_DN8111_c0_g1_i1:119-442(+)
MRIIMKNIAIITAKVGLFTLLSLSGPLSIAAELFNSKGSVSRQDILRGSITPERAWWDLGHYHLDIKVDPKQRTISGKNTMKYRVLAEKNRLQIELQAPMKLDWPLV